MNENLFDVGQGGTVRKPLPGTVAAKHPAVYSDSIIERLGWIINRQRAKLGHVVEVLDPMAGTGKLAATVHANGGEFTGVELEDEWAVHHPATWVGDATRLPDNWTGQYDVVMFSPAYGNRMADSYDASGDRCTTCKGSGCSEEGCLANCGQVEGDTRRHARCDDCGGEGLKPSKRPTYRMNLGHDLSDGSGAALHWGEGYRQLHSRAYQEARRVCKPSGLVVVNVSSYLKKLKTSDEVATYRPVAEWTLNTLLSLGLQLVEVEKVATPRMGFGANSKIKVPWEHIIVVRKTGWEASVG